MFYNQLDHKVDLSEKRIRTKTQKERKKKQQREAETPRRYGFDSEADYYNLIFSFPSNPLQKAPDLNQQPTTIFNLSFPP